MKEKYLINRFPKLKETKDLPVNIIFTQKFTCLKEGKEVIAENAEPKFISISEFQTSNIVQRAGHYKPISKIIRAKI